MLQSDIIEHLYLQQLHRERMSASNSDLKVGGGEDSPLFGFPRRLASCSERFKCSWQLNIATTTGLQQALITHESAAPHLVLINVS